MADSDVFLAGKMGECRWAFFCSNKGCGKGGIRAVFGRGLCVRGGGGL